MTRERKVRGSRFGARGVSGGAPRISDLEPRTSPRTTDPQHEFFDILDADGAPTGEQKPRWQVHRDGDWHAALHIWVYGVGEDGTPFVLFQRRSLSKDTWPGYLDVAVGGHLRAGESLEETAREAEEELGLTVTLGDLTPIGRHFSASERECIIDRELHHVYALRRDDPLGAYVMHPDEISAIVAIPIAFLYNIFLDRFIAGFTLGAVKG